MTNLDASVDSVDARIEARDRAARERAVDPTENVALEASAGTGKTRVLVDRYVNLLRAGVDPSNVLAITFTRKAAAEMRERILSTLRAEAARGGIPPARWRDLRNRLGDIAISTIDAFCLSLLREFPLEADLDPGFMVADETDVPRLVDQALDTALRTCRSVARHDEDVALVFAQLGERRARRGLAALLNRRISAPDILRRYLSSGPSDLSVSGACSRGVEALEALFETVPHGLEGFLDSGPIHPRFSLLAQDLRRILIDPADVLNRERGTRTWNLEPGTWNRVLSRTSEHFLTQDGQPRKQLSYSRTDFASERDWRRHREIVVTRADAVARLVDGYRRDVNMLVSRGIWRMLQISVAEYRRTLDGNAVLDFPEVLLRTLNLLQQMDEFARSRYRLESRYHHILVDECQDTSRAQWELISLLVRSWGEGAGLAHSGPLQPSIFVVGDPKQSIYGFRDADVAVLDEATRFLEGLRPGGDVRRSMSRSFRAVPALLAFVNDLCADMDKAVSRRDAFRYDERDRFPIDVSTAAERSDVLGIVVAESPQECAERVATEIGRLLADAVVRDRETGISRPARPGDVAILFRTRETHREFEEALEARGIPAYVYKGLGFFDADEVKDVLALLWYLGDPYSDLRAAGWLRSRFVRLSDEGLRLLAPRLAEALYSPDRPAACGDMDARDARVLDQARASAALWRALVDRMPPAELLDCILRESAYEVELRGPRLHQARENLKKMRALVRRIQNRGYATLGRIAEHIGRLSSGDESNAIVDALDAVHLMTVHAAKGLEFPAIFLVNLARGTGNRRSPIRVLAHGEDEEASVSVGDFQSDADEDAACREREETKRLLYVALTRARDRLYLSSVLKDGRLQPGRGSLAEVLPQTFADRFARAAQPGADGLNWHAASGTRHELHVCAAITPPDNAAALVDASRIDDFDPLAAPAPARRPVVDAVSEAADVPVTPTGRRSERLVGTLVHRLIDRLGMNADIADAVLRDCLPALLKPDDVGEEADSSKVGERAIECYRSVSRRPDVAAVIASGVAFHEIPFTQRVGETMLRGTIDCFVRTASGDITVLELKTGSPRREHRDQLEIYRRAVIDMFPGQAVNALLVYPRDPTIL